MAKERTYLDNDVIFNVLSRLPTKILVELKRICKGWHGVISNRSFIHTQLQNMKPRISGFIFQQKFHWSNQDINTTSYIHIGDEGFRLKHMAFDFLPDDVVALASCNGLVCCRSCFPTDDPAIYVCNPSNKEWVALQWAELDRQSCIALAFDPARDLTDTATDFKVVRVHQSEDGEEEDTRCTFEVYSSRSRVWKKAAEVCKTDDCLLRNRSVYIDGVLHWLTNGDKILTFRLDNELSWLISVPVPASEFNNPPNTCIGASEGKLHYVTVSEEGLSLWCLKDFFESEWIHKCWVPLEKMEREQPLLFCNLRERVALDARAGDIPWVNPLALEDDLLLMRVSTKIYLYCFVTGNTQKVCEASELGSSSMFFPTVLPYSVSLVPLLH